MAAGEDMVKPAEGYVASDASKPPEAEQGSDPSKNPKTSAGYSSPTTWENRYEDQDGTFDWYGDYAQLRPVFEEFCPPGPATAVLQLGCGNSAMSAQMHEAGYKRIINIDISASAVKKMEEQYADLAMEWHVMDATAMTFEDASMDLAVDKGTLDAMMHGGESGEDLAKAMTAEVWRTLKPGGLFVLISHNGRRRQVADRALQDKWPDGHWQVLERRKCGLSPQAMLINILRSKLNGRPLMDGFRDPELLKEATVETKAALKQMQILEAFRLFKAKKARQQQERAAAEGKAVEPQKPTTVAEDDSEDDAPKDRKQPFCWVYVLQKPA